MAMNFDKARYNMIESQIRPWEVLDTRVLDTLGNVRREDFVPGPYRTMAFSDLTLPLEHGEVMMKPVVEGRLLQALALERDHRVLEIGTGSGFMTACLAHLSAHVTSVDIHADFVASAQSRLHTLGLDNIELQVADAITDFQPQHAFDAIAVTGAVAAIPQRFLDWLEPGGRAFVIRGMSPVMEALVVHREDGDRFREESLFETDLPYLVHAAPPKTFRL